MESNLSRRTLLAGAGALGATTMAPASGLARAPMSRTQAPYFYRFAFGAAEVTVVSDGPLPLGDPGDSFLGVSKDEVRGMLTRNFLDTKNVVLEQNIPVVNMGDKLIMFDTGMGTSKAFGPTTGRLIQSLKEAGINPGDIDAICCSHAHIDHVGGIVDEAGKPLFPNAEIWLAQSDFDFWTDEAKLGSPLKMFIEHARRNLLPVRDRIKFFKDGQEFLAGVQAIAAPGHTVGHTVFMISSGGKSFCFMGDLTHHQVLLLERPLMEFAYDSDPKQSAQTRIRLLSMLAEKQTPVMSYHFPWPGFGNLAKVGDGFRYFAEPMKMVL
ncbi:MAG: MBL fold metallo-hydrolase [Beijerinckiaceae bacterium]